ncbi:MAG: AAA family ATPase [Candidatus Pacebacteria bacterium]|nr:AAA family ATPase [Candidatus Paceibacterota bacterium]
MYLKSIEISGFKSFGKKAQLDFNTPISSIVGPNGSGKSNVAEAFRFVLGEQSIKSLRGKRAEDLIFNGGKDAPRSNRASVKLIFNNVQRILNIDFDEVSIERVVNRDSSSEYLINNSSVRLKDIIELLSSAHIGSSGHQIISQGEADKVLNSNIRERREMVEDALGLKVYQYKKEESTRKLDKTEENIQQVESLRREIAPHIRFLKKQVEKIEKMAEMKEDLTKMYHDYFKREEEYINYEKKTIDSLKQPLVDESHKLEKELAYAREVIAKSTSKDQKSEEVMKVEGQLKEVRITKDTLARSIGRIEGEVSSMFRMIKKQEEANSASSKKTVELNQVENISKQIDLEIDSVWNNIDISNIKNIFENIRKILKNFIDTNKETEDRQAINDLENEIKNLEVEKKSYEIKISEAQKLETELLEQYTFLKNEIEKERDSNRDAEKSMFRIVAEQNDIRGKLSMLESRESRVRHDEEEFNRELQEASILVGVLALRYRDYWPVDTEGQILTYEQVVNDPRSVQEEKRRVMEKIKIRLEDAGVAGGDEVVKEFKETTERDEFLARELEDLIKSSESLKVLIKELDEKLTTEFRNGVTKINVQFQQFFSAMFGGGSASLSIVKEKKRKKSDTDLSTILEGGEELAPEEEDQEEGLDIEVNLPKKKIKGLMMLSGGERALTSIALLFAISQVNPPPFIILDETDAALDEANSKKYGDMITELSKYSQLILITHNRETMARAGIIYGVTMGADGVSRLLSIQFEEAVQVAK